MYLQLSQKLTQAMKILIDCMPKTEKVKAPEDDFDDFVNARKTYDKNSLPFDIQSSAGILA